MDKQYLHDLDAVYKQQMEEINENIDKEVRSEFQEEISRTNSANTQTNFWNSLGARFTNFRQAERDNQNTQEANQSRLAAIEERIDAQKKERSAAAAQEIGASIFEDFGGSREAAFQKLKEHEDQRKEEISGTAQAQFNKEAIEKKNAIDQQRGKAQWDFDVASGSQQKKQEAIKGKAQDHFQQVSQTEEQKQNQAERENNHQVEVDKQKEQEATVQLVEPREERANHSLDADFYKRAEQFEAQAETSNFITTSKESSYNAQMAARITKSFDRSEGKEQGISY